MDKERYSRIDFVDSEDGGKREGQIKTFGVKKLLFPQTNRAAAVMDALMKQRASGEFCDVQIKLSDAKTVYGHKAILASGSPYFEGMFSSSFRESATDCVDFSQMADNAQILELLINTFYGEQIEINNENVNQILNFATMLFLDDMKDACTEVLAVEINIQNIPEMLLLATNYTLQSIAKKVQVFLRSRFHDYIMYKEELLELSPWAFKLLLENIDTTLISGKSDYVKFILKWFTLLENEERAELLVEAIKGVRFKVNRRAYKMFENELEDVLNHLDYANSDISNDMKIHLQQALPMLKPVNYMKNGSPIPDTDQDDSDLEDEPVSARNRRTTFHFKLPEYGPPTEKMGFTMREKLIWEKHHEQIKERDQHRIWAKQWPNLCLTKPDPDPNRPKKIRREPEAKPFKTRKYHEKSNIELAEEQRLLDAVIVLAPSAEKGHISNESLDVTAYVPRLKGWYKLSTLTLSSINREFQSVLRQNEMEQVPEPSSMHIDDDDDDDEMFPYRHPLYSFFHDNPMSKPSNHRGLRDLAHDRHRSSLFYQFASEMMDDDYGDRRRFEERLRRRRRSPRVPQFQQSTETRPRVRGVPSLRDPKWSCMYFRQKLLFVHQDLAEYVFSFDITNRSWNKMALITQPVKGKEGDTVILDGIGLQVMGLKVYAFVRVVTMEAKRDVYYRHTDFDGDEKPTMYVYLEYIIFKMQNEQEWKEVIRTERQLLDILVDVPPKPDERDLRRRLDMREYDEYRMQMMMAKQRRGPPSLSPDTFRTFFYAADDEQIFIYTLSKDYYKVDQLKVNCYKYRTAAVVYFDLNETLNCSTDLRDCYTLNTFIPLVSDDMVHFLNDDLKGVAVHDLSVPPDNKHITQMKGYSKPEDKSEFLDSKKNYPQCDSIKTGDGSSVWILRGNKYNLSEIVQLTAIGLNEKQHFELVPNFSHPPPPYRMFTMAIPAKIDKGLVGWPRQPLKYQHDT